MAELKRVASLNNVATGSLGYTILQVLNDLSAAVNELKADFNAHTHTENTAATYTQNATTGGPSVTAGFADVDTIKLQDTNVAP